MISVYSYALENMAPRLHAKTSLDGGDTWSGPMPMPDGGFRPNLAQAPDGTVWLVYDRWTEEGRDIYYRTGTPDGMSWSGERELSGVAQHEQAPAVAVTDTGRHIRRPPAPTLCWAATGMTG